MNAEKTNLRKRMKKGLALAFFLSTMTLSISPAFAAEGDLSANGIWLTGQAALEGSTVQIAASALNNSNDYLLGTVQIRDNGELIGGDWQVSALPNSSDEVFASWIPQSAGNHTLTMTIYPWEGGDNPSNNVMSIDVYVEPDTDRDGIPNGSDPDDDNDGIPDEEDIFPFNNEESQDTDGDGTGDNADPDDDNDGVLDADDAFPNDADRSKDMDQDGLADKEDDDIDGDGLTNEEEMEAQLDPENPDSDGDGVTDGNDDFPSDETEWQDTDSDGIGDNSDDDIDGDERANDKDSDPYDHAPSAELDKNSYITGLSEPVVFSAEGVIDPDGEIINIRWEFPDGSILEGETVEKSFSEAGLFSANVLVVDDAGQVDRTQVNIRAYNYQFIILTLLGALMLISLAFYTIYRYTPRASKKTANKAKKAPKAKKAKTSPNKKS
jgi:hypothetical protein